MTTIVRGRARRAVSLLDVTVIVDAESLARARPRADRGALTRADGRVLLLDACAGSIETDGRIPCRPAAQPMATVAAAADGCGTQ